MKDRKHLKTSKSNTKNKLTHQVVVWNEQQFVTMHQLYCRSPPDKVQCIQYIRYINISQLQLNDT